MPVIPHSKMNAKNQKPSALCRLQFNRFQFARRSRVRLRRQLLPGHQITAPVTESSVTNSAPRPLILRPVSPLSRLSCKSRSQAVNRKPAVGRPDPRP
jgi:hypothetical protein